MYFPYIRTKQFDLAAILELDTKIFDGKIVPIIEPIGKIKKAPFETLIKRNIPFLLVVNPIVGDLKSATISPTVDKDLIKGIFKNYNNYWLAFIIQSFTSVGQVQDFIKSYPNNFHSFIHFSKSRVISQIADLINKDDKNQYNLFVEHNVGTDYKKYFIDSGVSNILIKDGFRKQSKNAKYPDESSFYDLHLNYNSDYGYGGFGDFTIIGSDFEEGGGPAYVVALHLTDIDEQNYLVVKHFKSDMTPPLTPADVAGKFKYALDALNSYAVSIQHLNSSGLDEYLQYHATGHFPGLGIPKKLSIKHHIETVHTFL